MDPVTHAATGALIGEALLGKKLGNRALVWGAVLGMLPDIDVVLNPFFSTRWELVHHRGVTHSLLMLVVLSLLGGWWLGKKRWKKEKVTPVRAGTFVGLVWASHLLLDCFTMYGTHLFVPFSYTRVSFDNVFVIDPLVSVLLLVGVIFVLIRKRGDVRRQRALVWVTALVTAYFGLTFAAKAWVSRGFEKDLARRGVTYTKRMESPAAFQILLWRCVVDRGDELWVGDRSVWEGQDSPTRWIVLPRGRQALARMGDIPETDTVKWFSKGYWIAREIDGGVWMADVRFGEMREWGSRGLVDLRSRFAWIIRPGDRHDTMRWVRPENQSEKEASKAMAKEQFNRMIPRIFGDRKKWDGVPRLAGVPERLAEYLRVVE